MPQIESSLKMQSDLPKVRVNPEPVATSTFEFSQLWEEEMADAPDGIVPVTGDLVPNDPIDIVNVPESEDIATNALAQTLDEPVSDPLEKEQVLTEIPEPNQTGLEKRVVNDGKSPTIWAGLVAEPQSGTVTEALTTPAAISGSPSIVERGLKAPFVGEVRSDLTPSSQSLSSVSPPRIQGDQIVDAKPATMERPNLLPHEAQDAQIKRVEPSVVATRLTETNAAAFVVPKQANPVQNTKPLPETKPDSENRALDRGMLPKESGLTTSAMRGDSVSPKVTTQPDMMLPFGTSAGPVSIDADLAKPFGMPIESDLAVLPTSLDTPRVLVAGPSVQPSNSAPQISAQIVAAITGPDAGVTEIRLNPEELGRVRISLTSTEAGLSVTILAERPETADLLRRNIETLAQDFKDLGYEDLTFEFGDTPHDASDDSTDDRPDDQTYVVASVASPDSIPHMTTAMRGGLDLKL